MVAAAVAVCVIGCAAYYFFAVIQGGSRSAGTDTLVLGAAAHAPGTSFKLETVSDQAALSRGLSGRSGLGAHEGMRFSYGTVGDRCIWMKDMQFNIDIVWLDASHRVVSMVQNVSPATYPHTYCAAAQDVIELPAGALKSNGVRPGSIVTL